MKKHQLKIEERKLNENLLICYVLIVVVVAVADFLHFSFLYFKIFEVDLKINIRPQLNNAPWQRAKRKHENSCGVNVLREKGTHIDGIRYTVR